MKKISWKATNKFFALIGTKLVGILLSSLFLGFIIILLPYIFSGRLSYIYFYLKPFFLQFFGSKESMWVFFAFLIIPIVELNKQSEAINKRYKNLEQAKDGLENELISNLLSIFAHNVDKPLGFYWFEKIDKELLSYLGSVGEKWKLFYDLYKEIYYYNDLVNVHFRQNYNDVAEYQFDMQMKLANFVKWETGLDALITDLSQASRQNKKTGRDTLSDCFENKKDECILEISKTIDDLFS